MIEIIRKFTGYKERRMISFAALLFAGLYIFPPTNSLVSGFFTLQYDPMPLISVPYILGVMILIISFMIFREHL